MASGAEKAVRSQLDNLLADDCIVRLSHPFGELRGSDQLWTKAYALLAAAWPDWERRDYIVVAGTDEHGYDWVGCAGSYMGTFCAPLLGIPPTGHLAHMRFHEFFRFEEGKVVETQAIWDLPEVMMQADAWPMAPPLGREFHVPGPATQDGIDFGDDGAVQGEKSCQLIIEMLIAMKRHPSEGGPELMELERFWHPQMNWYGPAGIGTCRGITGFRNWHQIPFLKAMPDRGQYSDQLTYHFFGEGNYVGVTGWPNMLQTHTGGGWLGLPPTGKKITLRSLDFWRIEDGLIRENWVLVDLLHVYDQLGVDVFARLGEFNKARNLQSIEPPTGY